MLRFWGEESLISWKVHSEDFPSYYAKRCNGKLEQMTEAMQRQDEISSNLSTCNNSVFSVSSTRNLGSSVSAGGLGAPQEQSPGRGQLG